jgi:hypothetical protein
MTQPNDQPQDADTFEQSSTFAAWAGSHGLDAHTGLALAGCTLAHIAGDSLRFQDSAGLSGMPPPSFLGQESDLPLRAALASLTGPISTSQHGLTLKSREHESTDVEAAMAECNRMHSRVRDDFEDQDGSMKEPLDEVASDMRVSRHTIRHEGITHPRLMMEGSPPADLAQALGSYHFGRAFLAGGVEQLPRDPRRRDQRLDQIATCVRGVEIATSAKSRSPHERVTASLRGILMIPDAQFGELLETRRDFLALFVPVASDPSALLPSQVDPAEVAGFHRMFSREAHRLIATRRAFAGAHGRICDPDWLAYFMGLRRDFLRECAALPAEIRTPAIISLPDLVTWTLVRLFDGKLTDDIICTQAFATARHLRDRAMRIYLAHDNARDAAKRKQLAERLIRRLLQVGPCKRRKLVRGSDDMRLLVHEPVISTLIQIGVFVETEDKVLTIGRVPTKSLPPTLFIETPAIP